MGAAQAVPIGAEREPEIGGDGLLFRRSAEVRRAEQLGALGIPWLGLEGGERGLEGGHHPRGALPACEADVDERVARKLVRTPEDRERAANGAREGLFVERGPGRGLTERRQAVNVKSRNVDDRHARALRPAGERVDVADDEPHLAPVGRYPSPGDAQPVRRREWLPHLGWRVREDHVAERGGARGEQKRPAHRLRLQLRTERVIALSCHPPARDGHVPFALWLELAPKLVRALEHRVAAPNVLRQIAQGNVAVDGDGLRAAVAERIKEAAVVGERAPVSLARLAPLPVLHDRGELVDVGGGGWLQVRLKEGVHPEAVERGRGASSHVECTEKLLVASRRHRAVHALEHDLARVTREREVRLRPVQEEVVVEGIADERVRDDAVVIALHEREPSEPLEELAPFGGGAPEHRAEQLLVERVRHATGVERVLVRGSGHVAHELGDEDGDDVRRQPRVKADPGFLRVVIRDQRERERMASRKLPDPRVIGLRNATLGEEGARVFLVEGGHDDLPRQRAHPLHERRSGLEAGAGGHDDAELGACLRERFVDEEPLDGRDLLEAIEYEHVGRFAATEPRKPARKPGLEGGLERVGVGGDALTGEP